MISQEVIQRVLGIKEEVSMMQLDMVKDMTVTFYPETGKGSNSDVEYFAGKIKEVFIKLGVRIVPYEQSLERVSFRKRFIRIGRVFYNNVIYFYSKICRSEGEFYYISITSLRRIIRNERLKKNIAVVVIGELSEDKLPMQFISSFKTNSIIHILPFPDKINEHSSFKQHFDTAMSLFAYHMANIIIAVDKERWMIYNFNASHPIYKITDENFEKHILQALVPKIVAPISPNKLSEFVISKEGFLVSDPEIKPLIADLKEGARLFDKTGLFPSGKKIEELPFRDNFHKYIGKLHLDDRSGMSFGFISKQLPVVPVPILTLEETKKRYHHLLVEGKDYFLDEDKNIHIIFEIPDRGTYSMIVPEIWVLSLRSGSNKTQFIPEKDLMLLGLSSKGEMLMKFPAGTRKYKDYKPSFDTRVILAHAVGNAIIASILKHISPGSEFVKNITREGVSISHWHGYFKEEFVPGNFQVYGFKNLHVACSSPQSAIYALGGKLEAFNFSLANEMDYRGDIHVEPHHGINVSYPSLSELAEYIINNPESSKLGNIYLKE